MLNSIRSQIFIACFVLSLVTAGIGIYGAVGITAAGKIATDTYDNPLQAINYARLASFVFSEMNNELLRQRLGGGGAAAGRPSLDALAKEFSDDLGVARQRSQSARATTAIDRIDDQVRRWNALRAKGGQLAEADIAQMDTLSKDIGQKFDSLGEIVVDDGFVQRTKADTAIETDRSLSIAAAGFAFALAIVITFVLAQRILKPLSAAASVANRIADGKFETAIPVGGAAETATLLRSMTVMQSSIRQMMEREGAQRRSAQNRLVDAIEGSREGMMLFDAERRILIANSQMDMFFPSLAGTLASGAAFGPAFANAKERPQSIGGEEEWLAHLSSDGEIELADGRWLRISQSATREGGWFLFFSDITPIKEREASLTSARQAAEAANVAKGNFLATMGHELRTPLNAVIGFSEMIASEQLGPLGNPSYVEYAGDVVTSARHLLEIINDVLELAKSADGKIKLEARFVDLTSILKGTADSFSEKCRSAGLKLDVQTAGPARFVWGDEDKLRQIMANLMSNAVKFSPSGGTVTLAVRSIGSVIVELVVADTGIGMRPEDIATALEPFGQIDSALARRYDGAGLGLPLTKALVELHGGSLEIESVFGLGTTVHVLLKEAQPELGRAALNVGLG